ncbi:MAG: iron-containing alcohol dehydrogenase [Herpetosiphon sp.]
MDATKQAMRGEYFFLGQEHVVFGPGSRDALRTEVEQLGGSRVLIITGRTLATKTDVVAQVVAALGPLYGATCAEIRQHTPESDVARAADLVRAQGCDLLLSVGGGSPIDATKAVALKLAEDGGKLMPHIAIPTTLSAAEFSHLFGVTNELERAKVGGADRRVAPQAVILDPELTLATPIELWLSSGIRAMDHAVETLYAPGRHPISDVLALAAIARLFQYLPQCKDAPLDTAVRLELQIAAWMSFFGEVNTPMGLSHNIGRRIGATYNVPHGITSCIALSHVMTVMAEEHAAQLAPIAKVLALPEADGDVAVAARAAARAVRELVGRLGLPQRLEQVGVGSKDLPQIAAATVSVANSPLRQHEVEALLRLML